MDRSSGFGSTPCYSTPLSDSLSLRLPYSVKLATQRKSLTHYTKGTPSPSSIDPRSIELGDGYCSLSRSVRLLHSIAKEFTHLLKVFCCVARFASRQQRTLKGSIKLGSDCLYACGFRIYFTPLPGFFSPFPHGTGSLSVDVEYLALEDGPPIFRQDFTCPALLVVTLVPHSCFRIRDYHPLSSAFPDRFANTNAKSYRLFRFRSPLLPESRLISIPPATEMFQFTGLALSTLCIQIEMTLAGRVSPFRNLRIKAHLPAPRSLSQAIASFIA
jgi:hypothetical protein